MKAGIAVGMVGVGNMGLAVALRLRELGHRVQVRDIDARREAMAEGCEVAASPAALARAVELLIVAVVDARQTLDVLFGSEGVVHAGGCCVMLCPTLGATDVESCCARLAEAGIDALDAPMSGGPERARQGTMSLMVAGGETLFARWQPLLEQLASRVFHVGTRPGDGARTKLVNNLLAAINLAGAAEAMALAGRLGLDAATTLAVIEASSGQSWIGSDRLRRALAGDAAPRAHVGLLAKVIALALAEADVVQLPAPLGTAAAARFAAALAAGLAAADDSSLWQLACDAPRPAPPQNAP